MTAVASLSLAVSLLPSDADVDDAVRRADEAVRSKMGWTAANKYSRRGRTKQSARNKKITKE